METKHPSIFERYHTDFNVRPLSADLISFVRENVNTITRNLVQLIVKGSHLEEGKEFKIAIVGHRIIFFSATNLFIEDC